MTEALLQFIWKTRMYSSIDLVNPELRGQSIEVLDSGRQNSDSGPDFFNAKIRIGNTIWAGTIEVHQKASDWNRHKHQFDEAYTTVVLHVVADADELVLDARNTQIPTAIMHFDDGIKSKYDRLMQHRSWIACEPDLPGIDRFRMIIWQEKLAVERLMGKASRVMQLLDETRNDWQECLYIMLARGFGQNLNALPFELMARQTPYRILLKNRKSPTDIEALLFGQAGMLAGELFGDEYYLELKNRYNFLQKKYKLEPIGEHLWKFARLRPSAFPTIRISQLAHLLFYHPNLVEELMMIDPFSKKAGELLSIPCSDYWLTHYTFNRETTKRRKQSGKTFSNLIWLNTLIPFMFAYGLKKGNNRLKEKALEILAQFPPESNSIVKKWELLNIHASNALQSQALIQLKSVYCTSKRCLDCDIGNEIIKNKNSE